MNAETPKQGGSGGAAGTPSQSASARSPLRRTLLFAGVFALLAMFFVPTSRGDYRLFFVTSDTTRVAFLQLLINVAFAGLAGAIVGNLSKRAERRANNHYPRFFSLKSDLLGYYGRRTCLPPVISEIVF